MNPTPPIPIACELSTDEQRRLTEAYRSGLFSHVEEVRERSGGFSLRFPWRPELVRELGEFVAVDSSCCSFLDHSVEIPRGKQVVWLHLTGPDEALGALKQEIDAIVPAHGHVRPDANKSAPTKRLGWAGVGMSGVGLLAGLCCIAPMIGISTLAIGSAWLVDATLAVLLTLGVGFALWYARRVRERRAGCCG